MPLRVSVLLMWFAITASILWASETGRVVSVIDGETIRVAIGDQVKTVSLIGVDAPESAAVGMPVDPLSHETARYLAEYAFGQEVRLERDNRRVNSDTHTHLSRYVYLRDGQELNLEVLREGLAFADTGSPLAQRDEVLAAERQARAQHRGLWNAELMKSNPFYYAQGVAHPGAGSHRRGASRIGPQVGRPPPLVAEDGSYYGQVSPEGGAPMTLFVAGRRLSDRTYIPSHFAHDSTARPGPGPNTIFVEGPLAENRPNRSGFDDESGCCKICTVGKACGDSCISRSYTCHAGPGCACDGP